MRGIFQVLFFNDAFGIDVDDSSNNFGKAILTVCVLGIFVFFSDTLPIQYSLDDQVMKFFCKNSETLLDPEDDKDSKQIPKPRLITSATVEISEESKQVYKRGRSDLILQIVFFRIQISN